MTDKFGFMCNLIVWGCVASGFFLIISYQVKRAINHRKMVLAAEKALRDAILKSERPLRSEVLRDSYMVRYIRGKRSSFRSRKMLAIRPEYLEWMRKITHVLGNDELSVSAYLDKVLRAHFDDNREIINDLYNEKLDGLFTGDDDGNAD